MRAPWTVARWNPGTIAADGTPPSTLHSARYRVTPTNTTISGRNRSIFFSRMRQPSRYSAGFRSSMPGLGRATTLVTPNPHSGSRTSSRWPMGSGTSPDSYNSFQKRLDGPAK